MQIVMVIFFYSKAAVFYCRMKYFTYDKYAHHKNIFRCSINEQQINIKNIQIHLYNQIID